MKNKSILLLWSPYPCSRLLTYNKITRSLSPPCAIFSRMYDNTIWWIIFFKLVFVAMHFCICHGLLKIPLYSAQFAVVETPIFGITAVAVILLLLFLRYLLIFFDILLNSLSLFRSCHGRHGYGWRFGGEWRVGSPKSIIPF